MQSQWRKEAAPIIARVLKETAGQDEKAIRKALRDAYPFGAREHHPYKIWCDEIRRQRFGAIQRQAKQVQQAAMDAAQLQFEFS